MNLVLLDIEGTIAPISFVREVLFPYSKRNFLKYLENLNELELTTFVEKLVSSPNYLSNESLKPSISKIAKVLESWVDQDIKDTVLKEAQGKIWKIGYEHGELKSPLYSDVLEFLDLCKSLSVSINIYSSGSIEAQKLFFAYNEYGDITHYFDHFFDTNIGKKTTPASYTKIASQLNLKEENIIFFSDSIAEIEASKSVGFKAIQVTRDSDANIDNFTEISSFNIFKDKFSQFITDY